MPETGGEIFLKNISDQGLVSIIYKELLEFNKKMATNFSKWTEVFSKPFTWEDTQMSLSTWENYQHN